MKRTTMTTSRRVRLMLKEVSVVSEYVLVVSEYLLENL